MVIWSSAIVNVASRMESNGARNAIHVSQDTADALIAGGYAHIIKAREDKIEAKGKGKLQTYWISPEVELSALEYQMVWVQHVSHIFMHTV